MKHNLKTFKFKTLGGPNPRKQKYRKSEVDGKINNLKFELNQMLGNFKKGGSLPYYVSDFIKELLGETDK